METRRVSGCYAVAVRVVDISDTAAGNLRISAGMREVYDTARSLPVRIEVVP